MLLGFIVFYKALDCLYPAYFNTCTNFQQSLVALNIELGHTARVLQHVTKEGFTHEWSVWVRGENDRSLADVVEKVVFTLHDSFKRPKRILKTPPFMITEKGYAGFFLPVEVFLQNNKQMRFEYDLSLQDLHAPPITLTRCERLTFYNPQEELKRKLLAAGGASLTPYARVAPLIAPGAASRQRAAVSGHGGAGDCRVQVIVGCR
ncbi:hypothetical protein HAZT_HAZT007586 [Hyalella azteca]|uniref:YEATS domain-containing protein n=1 Tax=Hyalella azteca TaxID=294128 RepID=A0A6A0H7Z5_HYAAZ|nr:hypothetical protein HAZT_HAZT007586 [Hyalella azteca]